ncbi:MAG: hypothetical protein LAP61_25170 [Acidobacteriia bacterium]|nr:hypothetical protein [Terriglobia bacterium]
MNSTIRGQVLATLMTPTSRHTVSRLGCAALALGSVMSAQTPPVTVLTIDMEHVVQYQENYANLQKNGTSTVIEAPVVPGTFSPGYFIADIVTINGTRSKGTTIAKDLWFNLNSNATGSQAIADITRFQTMDIVLEIQLEDGTALGTILLSGVTGGAPPLGAPKSAPTGNFAVVGGTGAFLGARGQAATIMNSFRPTSTFENPVNRRTFPGGLWKMAIELIPLRTPEIVSTTAGPVIVHSGDYSLVSAAKPANAGEVLTLVASGLGPTRPGVDPGQPFPASPEQIVNSPIDVVVNGIASEVLYSAGYPGTVGNYQVNFRVPSNAAAGASCRHNKCLASVQLRAAWVVGGDVKMPVQ